jgi:hypothetical protein
VAPVFTRWSSAGGSKGFVSLLYIAAAYMSRPLTPSRPLGTEQEQQMFNIAVFQRFCGVMVLRPFFITLFRKKCLQGTTFFW